MSGTLETRRLSIDALRGLAVALMALDHAQFFWSALGLPNDGLQGYMPAYASAFHQLTRALSHVCAPTFLFLAGMMMAAPVRTTRQLLERALVLIALQFAVENVAWWPASYFASGYKYFGILGCIGVSMLAVLAIRRIGTGWVLIASLGSIMASQLVSPVLPTAHPALQALAIVFYVPSLDPTLPMTSLFPVLHWFGFVGLGYAWGGRARDLAERGPWSALAGACLLVAALGVRILNAFGNRLHWTGEPFESSFFILSKYPPSLVYVLSMLGLVMLLLAIFTRFEDRLATRGARPLIVFGQAPLFFYVTHLFLYGFVAYLLGRRAQVGLLETWEVWLVGLVPMYAACERYRVLRAANPRSMLRLL